MKSKLFFTIMLAISGLSGFTQLHSSPDPGSKTSFNPGKNDSEISASLTGSCLNCPNYDFNMTPSTAWETNASSIEAYDCKMYRFYVTSGNTYTFKTGCGDGATANFDTYLELYNGSCSALTNNDDGCEYLRSTITWTAYYSGYVFLKVSGQGSSAGKYTLAYNFNGASGSCVSCPNYDFISTPTASWQTHTSSILANGCKMYRFYVTSGNNYTFKTGCGDGATANFDTFLELYNGSCTALANNDDGCENFRSFINWTANYSGYVYLKVKGYDTSAGSYTLSYRLTGYSNSCTSCPNYDFNYTPITAWATHSSNIETNGCKMYRFFVTSGNTYTFKTGCGDGATASFDTYLELYNGSCNLLASNDDGCEYYRSSINWTATSSGYVYLKVRGFSTSAGTYTLAFRYNGTSGTCTSCPNYDFNLTPTNIFQTHASSIIPNACKMYRFYVTSGNTYTFKTGCGDGATATFNTLLELFNNNCASIAINDDGCENNSSSLDWVANYSGYVYLKVSGIGSSAGKFTLAYRNVGTCGTCPGCPNYDFSYIPTSNYQIHSSSISVNGCKMYRFEVISGNTYTFKTGCGDGATANFDSFLELLNNNCSLLANDDDGCEYLRSSITWTANYSGYVYLKVKGYGAAAGTYNLSYRYTPNYGPCADCPDYDYNYTPGTNWQTHGTSISANGCRIYRFPVTTGNAYTFKTGCGDGATANFNTFLELFNSSCSLVAIDDDGCDYLLSTITWIADYTGYVYLKVSGNGSSSGIYNLAYKYVATSSPCVSCPNYDFNASTGTTWQTHSSTILTNGCKMYLFPVTTGNTYTFKTGCGDGAAASFDTHLELFNGYCTFLASDDNSCEYSRSSITWQANFTGYIYLKVSGVGTSSGAYNLSYRHTPTSGLCLSCPNFDFNYTPGTSWQTHSSNILPYGCKMYSFPVTSGNTYTFKTGCGDGATANFDTFLELFNSSCATLAIDDDGCEYLRSSISWIANYTGYVYLKVSGVGSSADTYNLAFRSTPTYGSCVSCPNYDFISTPGANWQTHYSSISTNGCKMYRFYVTSGNTYTFKTGCGDGATANFNTFLELFNSSCSTLAIDDDGCEYLRSSLTWIANYSGYVYLKVSGVGSSSGAYNMSYRYTPTSGSCLSCPNYDFDFTPTTIWGTHASNIAPNGCKMYRFWVIGGNTYTFKTGCGDGATANFDTYLELYNGSCSALAINDDGCESLRSSITWPANYTGFVYLKVKGWGSSAGNYTLAFNYGGVGGSCASCPNYDFDYTPVAAWQSHCSSILPNGCKMYRFPVSSGNTYTFKTGCGDGATANFNSYLELFSSSCYTLAVDDNGCENLRSSITWTANYSGYVYLKVSGIGSSSGTYNLSYKYDTAYGSCVNCPNYDFNFTPTTSWQTHCSCIVPNACKMYRFWVICGYSYTFKTGCGDGATASFDTYLELSSNSCYYLANNDDGCENLRSSITWTAGYSGYVYLKVSGLGSSSGTFNLAYRNNGYCGSAPVAGDNGIFTGNPETICSITSTSCNNGMQGYKSENLISGFTETAKASDMIVYPNPGIGLFTIAIEHRDPVKCQLSIYNVFGQCVYEDPEFMLNASAAIDISTQVNGVYHIFVRIGDELFRQKLIIQR